ncbi:MAG: hypothetical protein AB4057_23410 [Crocosphaera sp.]
MNQPTLINEQKIKEKHFDLLYQFAQKNMEGSFDFIFKQGSFLAMQLYHSMLVLLLCLVILTTS